MNMISDFSTGSSQKESEPIEKRAEKVIGKITQQEKEIVPLLKKEQKRRRRNRKFLILAILIVCALAFSATLYVNYNSAINHRSKSAEKVDFTVNPGDSIDVVAKNLAKDKLIISKNSLIFYARMNNKRNILAGKYQLSANMTIPEILEVLNKGQVNTSFNVTFLPGGTVKMAKATLSKIGYSNNEVDQAFSKDYSSEFPKLFAGKDKNTDLEGFLYGETHNFKKDTKVEDILRRFFTDFENQVVSLNLEGKFKKKGLTLYEGITLASIVQKETLNDFEDQQKVAGVFYNRLKKGMTLGSDVTYQYIADKLRIERSPNLDNPYNLRKNTGLTPSPIATPGISALKATADPIEHSYIFFLSGDDDKTYYGKTSLEHQENIDKYCKKKCQIL